MDLDEVLAATFSLVAPHLTERQRLGATNTQTGLRVRAELDRGRYPRGTKVRDAELAAVPLVRHAFYGECNYTMQPAADKPPPTAS